MFDGHGGVDAAVYAATHLHINLAQQGELLSSPGEALKKSFRQTDDMFLQKAKREVAGFIATCALSDLLQDDGCSIYTGSSWGG